MPTYAEEVATEAVKLPSSVKNIQPEPQRMPREEALAAIERMLDPHIRARWRKAATGGISADDLKPSIARLTGMVERMDRALQDAPWLASEEFSLADIDIAPFVQRLVRIDLFGLVAARPRVNDWYARMTSRPAYAGAMPPAGSEGGRHDLDEMRIGAHVPKCDRCLGEREDAAYQRIFGSRQIYSYVSVYSLPSPDSHKA